jgi:hypothetical protein
LQEDISISVAGGRNNLIHLMEAEKGTHVEIAHPLPVWVLDRGGDAEPATATPAALDADVGLKRMRNADDSTPISCSSVDSDMNEAVPLVRVDPLKAVYFIGLSLKDECKVCKGPPSPGSVFVCPIKGNHSPVM